MGIGTVPSVIALVLYAIMPIFQNAYAGLTGIDPTLLEAARVWLIEALQTFRVPAAVGNAGMIASGLRIAMVMIIGTATLAALIGGVAAWEPSLCWEFKPITTLNYCYYLVALLALVFSWGIKLLSKLSLKRIGIVIASLIVIFGGVAGYRALFNQPAQLRLLENWVVSLKFPINMYKDLIQQDNPRLKVQLKPNFVERCSCIRR